MKLILLLVFFYPLLAAASTEEVRDEFNIDQPFLIDSSTELNTENLLRPGAGRPGAGRPGSGRPGPGRPGPGRPGPGRPGSGHPGPGRPGPGHPGPGRPGSGHPGPGRPGPGPGHPGPGRPGGGGWHPPVRHPGSDFPGNWHLSDRRGVWRTPVHIWNGEGGQDFWRLQWTNGVFWRHVWRQGWWWGGDWSTGWVPNSGIKDAILFCGSDPNSDETYQCSLPGSIASVYITDTFTDDACIQGQTWGVYNSGVWTKRGCTANFQVFYD